MSVIRRIANGVVVPIPADVTTPEHLCTGVLTEGFQDVPESIVWRGTERWTEPPRRPEPGEIGERRGDHMFAGLLYGHFGHFLVESTARLWALETLGSKLDGIVFVPKAQVRQQQVLARYQVFLDLLGIDLPVENLTEPARYDAIHVPRQGFGMFGMIEGIPEYRHFMRSRLDRRITANGPQKLYVSRSELPHMRGGLLGEKLIEQHLIAEGYHIYHPQKHSFHDQLAAYKAADFIVSPDGSPLHMAALVARPGTRIAVVARRPNVALQFVFQFRAFCDIEPVIVNALRCHWIPVAEVEPNRLSHGELDVPAVGRQLAQGGLIRAGTDWPEMTADQRDGLMTALTAQQRTRFRRYRHPT